jgi:hypothetical protein
MKKNRTNNLFLKEKWTKPEIKVLNFKSTKGGFYTYPEAEGGSIS